MKNFIINFIILKKSVFYNQLIYAFDDFGEISYKTFVKVTKI